MFIALNLVAAKFTITVNLDYDLLMMDFESC